MPTLADDAARIMRALPQRFAKYGLELNTEKTQLVNFARPRRGTGRHPDGRKPGTFSFLGFVYYWGKTFRGGYTIKRKTEGKRIARTCSSFWQVVPRSSSRLLGGSIPDAVREAAWLLPVFRCALQQLMPESGILHGETSLALLVASSRRSPPAGLEEVRRVIVGLSSPASPH